MTLAELNFEQRNGRWYYYQPEDVMLMVVDYHPQRPKPWNLRWWEHGRLPGKNERFDTEEALCTRAVVLTLMGVLG